MFGVDWGNEQTLLVNLTNLFLGLCVLVLYGLTAVGVLRDLMKHR